MTRHGFQFRLAHIFILVTAIALGCGMTTWLGTAGLMLACAPLMTWITLNRTNGQCPWLAVSLGAASQGLLIIGILSSLEVLEALYFDSWPHYLFIGSITMGAVGGFLGMFVSIPLLALWYVIRSVRPCHPSSVSKTSHSRQ